MPALAQQVPLRSVIRESGSLVVIRHVTVIDGTGAAAAADQTVVIKDGAILAVTPSSKPIALDGAHVIDASGKTLIPGLVGMHVLLCRRRKN